MLGAEDAYRPNPSLSTGPADQTAQHEEERQVDDSRIESDGSIELNHMELTVDYKEGDDTPKEDHVQGVEGNRLRFMFNPNTEAVQKSCNEETCFTCFSSTRHEECLAKLERDLYQEEVELPFEDVAEQLSDSGSAPSGGAERHNAEKAEEAQPLDTAPS